MNRYIRYAALALMLASAPQPKQQQINQQPQQISCPIRGDVAVPVYDGENAVGHIQRLFTQRTTSQGDVPAYIHYLFYNSKSKSAEGYTPRTLEEALHFLSLKGYNIIEIFETNKLHLPYHIFSARIYISGGVTYVMFDLDGPQNLPDGEPDSVKCYNSWNLDLIRDVGREILEKRISEMEKNPPRPKKTPQINAA